MRVDLSTLLVILGMALATYATRAGGLWLMQRFEPSPLVASCLRHTPGAILVALVAPMVITGGLLGGVVAAVTVLVAARTGNVLLATGVGVAAVWLLRTLA